ncbi:nucleoside triphosphate pyrophosphatase [Synechococcus elongatus]|uniref:Nucleoside triphosphate pyrophosphatase n=1 Tax=Synechococcus elongatus PCC 11801 TaxID=2219813 RepID=A0AAN1UTR3_SYNEL|nr:nucleoside triphosphate pyrophosphatase [Synechococcus elongatus]AZB71795.1 septum formation inhibitor Maf [Synechococcus elongatus PCC 11801]
MPAPRLILASASPARRRLLATVGLSVEVQPSHFDESLVQLTDPPALVQELAFRKAASVARSQTEPALVLGCDSVLAINGEICGKPASPAEAIARWQQMRGQWGELHTGHALIDSASQRRWLACGTTRVRFAEVEDAEIEAYVATGEPLACAGAFALEGKGGLFIAEIQGCHTNVIGLSLPLLRNLLRAADYPWLQAWQD